MATLACSSTGRKDWQRLAGMIACSMRRQCYSVLHIAFKQSRSRLIYRDDALHSLRKKTMLHTCTCTRTLTFESIYRCISQFSTLREFWLRLLASIAIIYAHASWHYSQVCGGSFRLIHRLLEFGSKPLTLWRPDYRTFFRLPPTDFSSLTQRSWISRVPCFLL